MLPLPTVPVSAETTIEGLSATPIANYVLQLELFNNDAKKHLISIHPANVLSVSHYANYFTGRPEQILTTKLAEEEISQMYTAAYNAIKQFEFLETPLLTKDGTHYRLTLSINQREISISYYSISQVNQLPTGLQHILKTVNRHLPQNKRVGSKGES
jgi:hypothetical protein